MPTARGALRGRPPPSVAMVNAEISKDSTERLQEGKLRKAARSDFPEESQNAHDVLLCLVVSAGGRNYPGTTTASSAVRHQRDNCSRHRIPVLHRWRATYCPTFGRRARGGDVTALLVVRPQSCDRLRTFVISAPP